MAEEERQQDEETPEQGEAPDVAGEAAPEANAAEPAATEQPAEAPAATEAEPAEQLSPKERRRISRSRAEGPARPELTPEQRAAERAERRRARSAARRRYRQGRRSKRGEPRQGTPPAEREGVAAKVRQGTVVSNGADKTITVRVELVGRHPLYEKVVRRTRTLHAHDERNQASPGDVVRVAETRPLSRTKRWRLLEIVERAR